MHSFLKSKFQGFVHRGDASNYVENTLEAFKSAKSLGYHYIETDLRETKDGKVITFHDKNLKRISVSVDEDDYAQLKDLSRAGLSIGFLIREAIHDFLDKTKK